MSSISLKKVLKKQELQSLLKELVKTLNIEIDVEEVNGEKLFGIGKQTLNYRYPIQVSGNPIGWVSGAEQAAIVANLLSLFLKQEFEKKELARELLERYQEIDLFEDISTQLTTSLDPHQIAQLTLQKIHQLIESSAGIIILLKPNFIDSQVAAFEVITEFGQFFHHQSNLDQGIIRNIMRSGRAELVNDIQSDPRSLGQENVRALICVPLRAKERVLGAIAIGTQNSNTYTTEHLKLVSIFAVQTAVAIEKALLYEQSCQTAAQANAQADRLKQALKDLQLAQTQLIQSEKMSSLGQLIAGVAHEINNPVNFICGNVRYVSEYATDLMQLLQGYQQFFPTVPPELQSKLDNTDLEFLMQDMPKLLNSMKLGTDRIVEIVQSLKNFSRLDEAAMKAVDIHEGIDVTLMILRHRLKGTAHRPAIEVIKEYGKLPLVECYPGQLNQVFMNILANSIDAIDEVCENQKNKLQESNSVVSKDYVQSSSPIIQISTEVLDQDWVVIRIADTGSGMPEEVIQRIYDPFFTTKAIGKGTGLGMAISYQLVVEKHRGMLKCRSQPHEGTEFWIQIPIKCLTLDSEAQHPIGSVTKQVISPASSATELPSAPDQDNFTPSALPTLQPSDLLLRHIQLLQRLAQQHPEIENLSPEHIYRIFQHNPISLKLYASLLSQFYSPNYSLNQLPNR